MGTHAHAFVSSFTDDEEIEDKIIVDQDGNKQDFWSIVSESRKELGFESTNTGELKAFTAFALSFPSNALLLVDTYDTISSGLRNFIVVAYALHKVGHKAKGIRLDSGDLAYLSNCARKLFVKFSEKLNIDYFKDFTIVASNDINVETLESLNQQGHSIDTFGIGTNLVTCQAQPALGCVYKLVEIEGNARIKLSQDISKVTLPGKKVNCIFLFFFCIFFNFFSLLKNAYRLWGTAIEDFPVVDLMTCHDEDAPKVGDKILCRNPFVERQRVYVTVTKVAPILELFFDSGKIIDDQTSLSDSRNRALQQIKGTRKDHLRILNPTPYKVSVTAKLYDKLHDLWLNAAPITEL